MSSDYVRDKLSAIEYDKNGRIEELVVWKPYCI